MTYTYAEDLKPRPATTTAEPAFTPVYARKHSSRNKPVKTWMIMAPIGLLVLGGAAAAMLMNPASETTPLAEPASTPAVLPSPVETPPAVLEAEPLVVETAPAAEVAPAPVRTQRRAAPAARRAAPPAAATPRVETPAQPGGPQPYAGSLNTGAPTPAPTTTTPAPTTSIPAGPPPVVVIEPQG